MAMMFFRRARGATHPGGGRGGAKKEGEERGGRKGKKMRKERGKKKPSRKGKGRGTRKKSEKGKKKQKTNFKFAFYS